MSNFVHLGSFGNLVDHGIHPVGHLDSIASKCALVSRRKLVSEPLYDRIVYSVSAAAAGLSDATSLLASAGATLLAIPIKLLGTLAAYAPQFSGALARVQPVAVAIAGVLSATMAAVITWVVGRDLLPHGVSRR